MTIASFFNSLAERAVQSTPIARQHVIYSYLPKSICSLSNLKYLVVKYEDKYVEEKRYLLISVPT